MLPLDTEKSTIVTFNKQKRVIANCGCWRSWHIECSDARGQGDLETVRTVSRLYSPDWQRRMPAVATECCSREDMSEGLSCEENSPGKQHARFLCQLTTANERGMQRSGERRLWKCYDHDRNFFGRGTMCLRQAIFAVEIWAYFCGSGGHRGLADQIYFLLELPPTLCSILSNRERVVVVEERQHT